MHRSWVIAIASDMHMELSICLTWCQVIKQIEGCQSLCYLLTCGFGNLWNEGPAIDLWSCFTHFFTAKQREFREEKLTQKLFIGERKLSFYTPVIWILIFMSRCWIWLGCSFGWAYHFAGKTDNPRQENKFIWLISSFCFKCLDIFKKNLPVNIFWLQSFRGPSNIFCFLVLRIILLFRFLRCDLYGGTYSCYFALEV